MRNRTRLISISELDFLACFKHGLYGRNSNYLKCWDIGDTLVFVNGDFIVGCAVVNGDSFTSREEVWDSDVYPYRIPIIFSYAFVKGKRPSFIKHRNELRSLYGKKKWGFCFGNTEPLPDDISFSVMSTVQGHEDCSKEIRPDIDLRLAKELNKDSKKKLQKAKASRSQKPRVHTDIGFDDIMDESLEELVVRLTAFCGMDPEQFVNDVTEESFRRSLDVMQLDNLDLVGWDKVKRVTGDHMRRLGLFRPLWVQYGPGTYLVVGESHGQFTKDGVWNLLHEVNKTLKPDKIFHVGHAVDNNGLINHELAKFDNMVVVTRIKEAPIVEEYAREFEEEPFGINRDGVHLGHLIVANQDFAAEYMMPRTDSKTMMKGVFTKHVLFNHQYVEIGVASTDQDEQKYVRAYTGCLCEPHAVRETPDIKYEPGTLTNRKLLKRLAGWMSRIHSRKYQISKMWTQGMFVVHVDENMNHTMVPCMIKKTFVDGHEEYATSYFDKIISESGVHEPDKKFFMNADLHVSRHCPEVLSVQEEVVKDYKPDVYVNLGDMANYEGFNHHKAKNGEVVLDAIIEEVAQVHGILRRTSEWAPECHILMGNHERFAHDFVKSHPQFKGMVEFEFLCSPEAAGFHVTPLQDKLQFGKLICLHGDLIRGGTMTILDRYAMIYSDNVVIIGHLHHPAIRQRVHMSGLSGEYDQEYNSVTVSKWCHGFVMVNQYAGEFWPCTMAIVDNEVRLNGKCYRPGNVEKWRNFPWKPEIRFVQTEQELSNGLDSQSSSWKIPTRKK